MARAAFLGGSLAIRVRDQLGEERLGGQVERVGDRFEHAHRWLVQAALDLSRRACHGSVTVTS
jgi:hypothetical protein